MKHTLFALILGSVLHVLLWLYGGEQVALSTVSTKSALKSLSYAPYVGFERVPLSDDQIASDIALIYTIAEKIRTYSATDAAKILPLLKENQRIELGLWISSDDKENQKEIMLGLELLRAYNKKITSVIVGNEVILRKDLTPKQLIKLLIQVDNGTRKPVTTAEVHHIWLENPRLVKSVNFITVHILPYWEYIPIEEALAFTKDQYDSLQKAYPTKPIVIGEFGWPSRGYNNKKSIANLENEVTAISEFLQLAHKEKWNYNIVEAFDQPWKGRNEGSVGPYWGLYDAARRPKFNLYETTLINPYWRYQMVAAVFFGALLTFFGLRHQRKNFWHALTYALAAQAMGFSIALAAIYPWLHYLNAGMWVMWGMGIVLMIPLVVTTLVKVNELFRCTVGRAPERLIPLNLTSEEAPFVSIHVPAYKEQPHVLLETLEALAKLQYTHYEVLVIINNTPDAYYWESIEAYCEKHSEHFKFLNITCTGFKAGALNVALTHTDEKTDILAIIDADYVVSPSWLVDLVPLFDDPKVAVVQAPQDHRDGNESLLKRAMNAEYAGFFDIGMVERNEENAIVVHGTMLMVRLNALKEVGGWGTDTIVEDSELGLRLFEAGYTSHYTNRRYGWGLLPDTIQAFKTQRHRWAYGAVQILKKHLKHFSPRSKTLTGEQKHHFISGWLLWLFDAMGPVMALLNIIWVPIILFIGAVIPMVSLTVPIITAFVVNILHAFILYRSRVKVGVIDTLLSSVAAMSLQLIIFKAVFDGFVKDNLPFKRTEKGGNSKKSGDNPIFYESIFAVLLLVSGSALIVANSNEIVEQYLFAVTLLIQSVPYLSAIGLRGIEKLSLWK